MLVELVLLEEAQIDAHYGLRAERHGTCSTDAEGHLKILRWAHMHIIGWAGGITGHVVLMTVVTIEQACMRIVGSA